MVTDASPVRWSVVTASARGSAHRRNGKPNQDAVLTSQSHAGLVVAVADGHGGRTYTRSSTGSRFAVEVAVTVGEALLTTPRSLVGDAGALPDDVVARWRTLVADDLASQPLDEQEKVAVGTGDPTVIYGSTLLMLVARSTECVILQLGDGDVVVAGPDGRALRPVPLDDRNVAGQTTSLCLPDAARSFRVVDVSAHVGTPRVTILATDGYGNSFADASWPQAVVGDLTAHLDAAGPSAIVASLEQWVSESAEVGGDDTSVAIVLAEGAGPATFVRPPAPPLTPRPAAPVLPRAPATPPAPRRARGAGWMVALTVVGLAAGGALGWAIASIGDDGSDTVVLTTASPTIPTSGVATTAAATSTIPQTTASASVATTAPTTNSTTLAGDEPALDGRVRLTIEGGEAIELDVLDEDPTIRLADTTEELPRVELLVLPETSWRIVFGEAQWLGGQSSWRPATAATDSWSLAAAGGRVAIASRDGTTVWVYDASDGTLIMRVVNSAVNRGVPTSTVSPASTRP